MCLLSVDHTDQLMSESTAASRLLQILGLHFRLPAERSLTQVTIKNIIKVLFHSGSRWTAVQTKHPRCSSLSRWGRDAFHFLLEAIGSLSQARTVKSPLTLMMRRICCLALKPNKHLKWLSQHISPGQPGTRRTAGAHERKLKARGGGRQKEGWRPPSLGVFHFFLTWSVLRNGPTWLRRLLVAFKWVWKRGLFHRRFSG